MRILAAFGPVAAQPPHGRPGHDWHRGPDHRDRRHGGWHGHRRCRTVWHHGHRVRRCY